MRRKRSKRVDEDTLEGSEECVDEAEGDSIHCGGR